MGCESLMEEQEHIQEQEKQYGVLGSEKEKLRAQLREKEEQEERDRVRKKKNSTRYLFVRTKWLGLSNKRKKNNFFF